MVNRPIAFLLATCLTVGAPAARAVPFAKYEIKESTINRLIGAAGSFTGSTGSYSITVHRPCIPDFWNTCTWTFGSGRVYWTVYNNTAQINTSGVKLHGSIEFDWSVFSYTVPYQAPASITYSSSASELRMSISSVSIPVTFFGHTFTTISFSMPYTLVFATPGFPLPVARPSGGERNVNVRPGGVAISTQTDLLRVQFDPRFF